MRILNERLEKIGFTIINDRKGQLIEQIKNLVIEAIHYTGPMEKVKWPEYLSDGLHLDYKYLSSLFSAVESITLEQYIINQKIEKIKEFNTNARSDLYQFTKEDYKNSIRQAFFLDKLLLPPREEIGEMTAFETAKRIEQTQRVLGPTFGRLNQDFLQPFVIRNFKMMLRAGAFQDPPRSVQERGLNIEVKFVNALARSQQIEEVTAIQEWAQMLGGLAQLEALETEATDLMDVDEAGEISARILGVPEGAIRDQKVRDERRSRREEERAQALQAENQLKQADAASKIGQ